MRRRGLLQAALEQGVRVPGHGRADVIGGGGDVEVVGEPGVQVGSALREQGEPLPQRGEGAVEAAVREVRGGGVVGGVADGPCDVTPDEGDDVRLAPVPGRWSSGAPGGGAGPPDLEDRVAGVAVGEGAHPGAGALGLERRSRSPGF